MKITVLIIKFPFDRKNPNGYKFEDQINQIKLSIRFWYEKEKKKETPPDKIFFVWPEYMLFNLKVDEQKRSSWDCERAAFLDKKQKDFFKQQMQELTQKYPDLCIIGTIPYTTPIVPEKRERKLEKLRRAYQDRTITQLSESHQPWDEGQQPPDAIFANPRLQQSAKNRTFCFWGNSCEKQDKICLARELSVLELMESDQEKVHPWYDSAALGNIMLFSPGTHTKIIKVFGSIPIAMEICRTHTLGVLKREIGTDKRENPFFHFVISDGCSSITKDNAMGGYTFLVDADAWAYALQKPAFLKGYEQHELFIRQIISGQIYEVPVYQEEKISPSVKV